MENTPKPTADSVGSTSQASSYPLKLSSKELENIDRIRARATHSNRPHTAPPNRMYTPVYSPKTCHNSLVYEAEFAHFYLKQSRWTKFLHTNHDSNQPDAVINNDAQQETEKDDNQEQETDSDDDEQQHAAATVDDGGEEEEEEEEEADASADDDDEAPAPINDEQHVVVTFDDGEDAVATGNNGLQDCNSLHTDGRERRIQRIAQSIVEQSPNDPLNRSVFNLLDLRMADLTNSVTTMDVQDADPEEDNTASSMTNRDLQRRVTTADLPPDSALPSILYRNQDRSTISKENNFDLSTSSLTPNDPQDRFRGKSYAIIASRTVPKEAVKQYLLKVFGPDKLEYICIGEDTDPADGSSRLLMQIIFKERLDRRKPFLKDILGDSCNYKVTSNDLAWNEFIKQCPVYDEYKEFKCVKSLSHKEWETLINSPSLTQQSVPNTPSSQSQSSARPRRIAPKRSLAQSGQPTKIRKVDDEIARVALALAKDSVEKSMLYTQEKVPAEFIKHQPWYFKVFTYVRLQEQQRADREGVVDKEYVWPNSFPNCTPTLRAVIERWIKHHFFRAKRAKCLVLIGPTGTGKTSFALSLPGRVNYFKGEWSYDNWSDYARYSVYDDIPWNKFRKHGFPNKKDLLTQNSRLAVNTKYKVITNIDVKQPAIVLMNREDAGSLLARPRNTKARDTAAYWKKRATVYVMEPDDTFFPKRQRASDSVSTTSSMDSTEPRMGGPHEFDQMNEHHHK